MRLFRIKREEWIAAFIMLLFLIALNVLAVSMNHYELFTRSGKLGYWTIFWNHYHVSGFDSFTYIILSHWRPLYSAYRHPLLALMIWPFSQLNEWLMHVTGYNCAVFIVAFFLIALMFYSFIFAYRILREVIGLKRFDATLLSFFLYSFAYVMLTAIVPDHFAISMFILTLTLYVAGRDMQKQRQMKGWKVALYYFLATGVTLTNGIKIFLAQWFVNGKKTWHWRNLLFTFVLPTAVLFGAFLYQDQGIVAEDEQKSQHIFEERIKKDSVFAKRVAENKERNKEKKLVSENEFLKSTYTDVSISKTIVENLFGESIQLHDRWLLQDVNHNRPVFVNYRHLYNYVIEAIIILLFLCGIWQGRHSRFLWLCMSWFAFDMLLHLVLGFAIIEPYIMTGHWIFVMPIAIAFLLKSANSKLLWGLRTVIILTMAYLYVYNGYWLVQFFMR